METRVERVAKRRMELLTDFHNKFAIFCEEADGGHIYNWTPHEKLEYSVRKLDLYIQGLIKQKPQETSFYTSVALEFQRQKIAQMDAIVQAHKLKETQCPQ